jgi:S1-C subfamily serine protease
MRGSAALLALFGALAACGGGQAKSPQVVGKALEREREVASPGMCIGKQRIFEAMGVKDKAGAAARRLEKYRTDPLSAAVSPSEAYRLGAPSTVIIRTRDGLGSGVVVDASGLVLTNYHVVDDFLQPNLTMSVSLEIGETEATGRVKRSGKVFQGEVLKADSVKDLALVRMKDPPKGLVAVRLSEADPQVGEDMLSIGHAGIGLLWAAKVCNVSGIGDQTQDTSMLEVGDCKLRDQADSDSEAKRREEQCEARKRQVREMVASATQGVAVQTSCNITHGDSGGPLLNLRGELVGLNQSLRFDAATVAFHVHVAEIRAFLHDVPKAPGQILPDPWCEGGSEATWEDVDGDGKKDTIKLGETFGGESGATFVDLDQDDDPKARSVARPFDAEVIMLSKRESHFVFYDTDGDGKMDLVLRDKEGEGKADTGWRLRGGGFEADASLKDSKIVDVALLKSETSRQRLGAIAQGLGWSKFASEATMAVAENLRVPDIYTGSFQAANAMADEPNDKPFGVQTFGGGSDAMFLDVRSEELQKLKGGDDARKLLETRSLKPDFVSLGRPNGRWVFYDSDGDGTLDLAMFGKSPSDKGRFFMRSANFVTDAFDLRGSEPKRTNKDVGRALVRMKLIGSEKARKAAQKSMRETADDGRTTFPQVWSMHSRSPWRFASFDGAPRKALEKMDESSAVVMVDLDGNTKDLATKGAEDFSRQQSYEWEAAFIRQGNLGWALYDTDNDGVYDLVLFTRDVKVGEIDASYTIDRGGEKVTQLPSTKGSIVQPERITKSPKAAEALREAWQRVVDSATEEDEKGAPKRSSPARLPRRKR